MLELMGIFLSLCFLIVIREKQKERGREKERKHYIHNFVPKFTLWVILQKIIREKLICKEIYVIKMANHFREWKSTFSTEKCLYWVLLTNRDFNSEDPALFLICHQLFKI